MATKAYGRMVFWEGASLWILGKRPDDPPFPKTAFHSHHAVQVTLALRGSFALEGHERRVAGAAAAVVAPDVEHAFEAEELVAHLFVDPEGRPGRELQSALMSAGGVVPIASERPGELPARLLAGFESARRTDKSLVELGRSLLAQLAPGGERDERPEVRVRRMSAWAAERLDAPISLADAAKHIGLSSGRARHLFVEETGLPFRTYLLWLRLNRAVELYSGGSSLTEAAHGAGFSDSSHFSRTFRRMFGIAADSLRVSCDITQARGFATEICVRTISCDGGAARASSCMSKMIPVLVLFLIACGSPGNGGDDDASTPDGPAPSQLDPMDCAGIADGFVAAATSCGTPLPGNAKAQFETMCKKGIAAADKCGGAPARGFECLATPDASDWACVGGDVLPACNGDLGASLGALCVVALGNPACATGIACEFDADCSQGLECNGATGQCFDKNAYCIGLPCEFDADCPQGETCNGAEKACVGA